MGVHRALTYLSSVTLDVSELKRDSALYSLGTKIADLIGNTCPESRGQSVQPGL